MSLFSQVLLALGMSADAFAASLAKGSQIQSPNKMQIFQYACIFGLVEMATPLMGWGLGWAAAPFIESYDHWLAFVLLGGLGVKMIYENATSSDPHFRQPEKIFPIKINILFYVLPH